ncbi:MAG TPA: reverse transcriptase N-terminal domain-containing protein [Oculatellaceae cyanobacterium]
MNDNRTDRPDTLISSWHDVDWKSICFAANIQVAKLRFRIFTCCKNKDFKQLKSLQRLLLKSNANLLVSIKRVTQINAGKKTSGVDEDVRLTPQERLDLYHEMRENGLYNWNPLPVLKVYIPKPDGR